MSADVKRVKVSPFFFLFALIMEANLRALDGRSSPVGRTIGRLLPC